MVIRSEGKEYSTNPRPLDRIDYITRALQDYFLRVLEEPITPRRLTEFYKQWDVPEDPSIKRDIENKIRVLHEFGKRPFPS